MKHITLSFILSLLFSLAVSNVRAQKIDLTSVDAFFRVAQKIQNQDSINHCEWDSLFKTPGYAIIADHFGERMVEGCMTLAFDLRKTAERDVLLTATDKKELDMLAAFVVNNYIEMGASWEELKNYRATYDFQNIEKEAVAILKNFLGNPPDSLISFPNLTFMCFDANARSLNKGISMDLNRAYNMTTNEIAATLAHEMFHEYRSGLLDGDFLGSSPAIGALARVQNEGMADLVDKHSERDAVSDPMIPSEVVERYMRTYVDTPVLLQRLDSLTIAYVSGGTDQAECARAIKSLFAYDGHPNGYYMAILIKRNGLLPELLCDVANPVQFARLYNKAAKMEGGYVLSSQFMRHIEEQEKIYLQAND